MRNLRWSGFSEAKGHLWPVLILGAVILLGGCQAREAPLSPGAATFKQELKNCLDNLAANLLAPVAKKDVAAITAALEKVESPAVKLCRLCPFEIGVLNPAGETLAVYPCKGDSKAKNFSNYELIIKAAKSKKIQQQRFFLQDGSQLYMVCAPLIREEIVIGLVAVAISSKDAEQRYGLKEKEFLALDFNT
jgi:hypothetical protein